MSDIKRYDLVGEYDLSMEEMTEGDYVLYSDHEQQLKEANDELEVERMRLAGCSVAALGYFDGCDDKYKSASLDDVLSLYEQLKERDALLDEVLKAEALPSHPHSACYFYISQDLSNRIKNRNKP